MRKNRQGNSPTSAVVILMRPIWYTTLAFISLFTILISGIARADVTVHPKVVAGDVTPDPMDIGQEADGQITATIDDAPQADKETQVDGPYWNWSYGVPEYSTDGVNWTTNVPAGSGVVIAQSDSSVPNIPDARLTCQFDEDGYWRILVTVSVVYHVTVNGVETDYKGSDQGYVGQPDDTSSANAAPAAFKGFSHTAPPEVVKKSVIVNGPTHLAHRFRVSLIVYTGQNGQWGHNQIDQLQLQDQNNHPYTSGVVHEHWNTSSDPSNTDLDYNNNWKTLLVNNGAGNDNQNTGQAPDFQDASGQTLPTNTGSSTYWFTIHQHWKWIAPSGHTKELPIHLIEHHQAFVNRTP